MVTNYSENAIDSRITLLNVRHYTEIRKSNIASTEPLNDFEVERTAVTATVKFTFARSHLAALKNCKNWFPTSVRSDRSIVLVATLSSENLRRSAKKPRNRIIQWQRPREKSTRVSIKFAIDRERPIARYVRDTNQIFLVIADASCRQSFFVYVDLLFSVLRRSGGMIDPGRM